MPALRVLQLDHHQLEPLVPILVDSAACLSHSVEGSGHLLEFARLKNHALGCQGRGRLYIAYRSSCEIGQEGQEPSGLV